MSIGLVLRELMAWLWRQITLTVVVQRTVREERLETPGGTGGRERPHVGVWDSLQRRQHSTLTIKDRVVLGRKERKNSRHRTEEEKRP